MPTISVVMIVKNEKRCLADCIESLKDVADEIIVVDTGSTDSTKEIAARYTDKIYDFEWTGSFSDARNFAFSKAAMDYIYSADADEILDEENQKKLKLLKSALMPEVEIVQMYYVNQLEYSTVYNYDRELRPKLFKRLREFVWIEPIHETVRTSPVVFDSDIEIIHKPANMHAERDLAAFEKLIAAGEKLSERLEGFYSRELFIAGDTENFKAATAYYERYITEEADDQKLMEAFCILAMAAYKQKHADEFFKYAMKVVTLGGCSEICCLLGEYYFTKKDYNEAYMWFYNAANETESILNLSYKEKVAAEGMERCHDCMRRSAADSR